MLGRICLLTFTDHHKLEEGSKSNIAARFQNALNLHVLPPIGVFWDIENCQVPKGKSAIALVQNIREIFFKDHREAEFMCVCDINKESKVVIQELLFAQVTVVHISATSKNAADDKLKQCMKRFVDTHGAPATLLLISDDVNFASDLSDFRHRHNIRIILIHRGHAHPSLLTCAHEHYTFSTITQDLPVRSPVKSVDNRPCELIVSDLPVNRKEGLIKNRLLKLSNNCGGKVVSINGSKAIIRFANADFAARAKKRMDKEIVFGNKICVNFRTRCDTEYSYSPPRDHAKDYDSSEESYVTSSSRDSSLSPRPKDYERNSNTVCNNSTIKKFDFPPPPVINEQNSPSLLKEKNFRKIPVVKNLIDNSKLFVNINNSESSKEQKLPTMDWNNMKSVCHTSDKFQEISAFSPFKKDQDYSFKKYSQRNVGRVSPFFMQDSDLKSAKNMMHLNDSLANRRNHATNSFQMYSSHSFHGLSQSITVPLNEIQRISDPIPFCAQWPGPSSLSIDSAPSISNSTVMSSDVSSCVELHVSNLDPTFEVNEMKKILLSVFSEHVMVIHISMSLQPDGSAKATVKVPSPQDAQYAISRLHRRKIGHKRILISHATSEKSPPFHVLKSETTALLNDIPAKNLPLIKFRELYEKRYHRPIAVSELYKMRDAVTIQGDSGSRMVYLNSDYYKTPSLPDSEDSQEFATLERPYCERHFQVSDSQGWAEQYSICPLPLVYISLKTLSPAVHRLLDTHQGSLPLISFCDCYEAEIGLLPVVGNVESSSKDDDDSDSEPVGNESCVAKKGVPLEHLIACVTGVEVAKSVLCIKKVQWLENKMLDNPIFQNFSPALAGQLTLFGREVMDLLKNQPQCLVAFNKFIPTYHHHFGRQCRVADYGFTKLIDLLEAIPHIVQVLGEGQNRQVTLTHRSQVKRFAAELLRILKSRASKQISISEFPHAYEQVIEKPFDLTSYGVCDIQDMLDEVPENVIVICKSGSETVIGIPKREQTAEEIEHTKQFASEVIELMKHTPHCTMAFNKFIPAYHHHFGKQCRVADYGFTKLIELFEAIPDVLEVSGTGEDKVLKLVEKEQHKILSDRLVSILKMQPNEVIDINQISAAYALMHGHALRPMDFGFTDLHEMLEKMDSTLRIVVGYGRTYITLVDQGVVHQISFNVCVLLMETHECKMSVKEVCKIYMSRFGLKINLSLHLQDMANLIQVVDDVVQLTPLHKLARDMILLLQDHGGQIPFSTFGSLFQQKFGKSICTAHYGFPNLYVMLENLSDYFTIKGKKHKRTVCLNTQTVGQLPDFTVHKTHSDSSHVVEKSDILSDPVPSCVPSPNLKPDVKETINDFMGFETPVPFRSVVSYEESLYAKELSSEDSMHSTTANATCTVLPHQISVEGNSSYTSSSMVISPSVIYFNPQLYVSSSAQTSALSPKEPTYVQSSSVIANHKEYVTPIITHVHVGPSIISMDHGNQLPHSSYSEEKTRLKDSIQNIRKSKEFESCEDLTKYTNDAREKIIQSSKSTPTKTVRQLNRRKRIAAQFSMPIE